MVELRIVFDFGVLSVSVTRLNQDFSHQEDCSCWVQREVAEHIVAALDAGGGSMDQLCRLLLAADSYSVVLLRNYCLAGLAQAFHSLQHHTAREQTIFEAFVDAVAPKVCIPVVPAE